jgi:hypothetical protein
MSTTTEVASQKTRFFNAQYPARTQKAMQEAVSLGLACSGLCMLAIALTVKFPSIAEAVVLLS